MEGYYGSHADNNGHFVPQQYIPEDLTSYQNNVYEHYNTASNIIVLKGI